MINLLIDNRGIEEVLHFSTQKGVVGILDSRFLKSHERVREDQRLEFILQLNAPSRRDNDWLDYVNLSITNINYDFFKSSKGWHGAHGWAILSFSPDILTHDGVYFSTTNNVYPCAKRGLGSVGLSALFADQVEWGYYGYVKSRLATTGMNETTDIQAEVLYPEQLSIEYLRKIYVIDDEAQDNICGLVNALGVVGVAVIVAPHKFKAP